MISYEAIFNEIKESLLKSKFIEKYYIEKIFKSTSIVVITKFFETLKVFDNEKKNLY